MKTVILGKESNLTNFLVKEFNNAEVVSFRELKKNINSIDKLFIEKKNTNIIINGFYPASKLSKLDNYENYVSSSVLTLAKITNILSSHLKFINKIIYSSSSSTNELNSAKEKYNNQIFDQNNRYLNASSKFLCENIVKNFCQTHNVPFIIARIFNIYGGNDNFSVVSKIISAYKSRKKILINNQGKDFRDFIHVSDVAKTYKKIINSTFSGYLDIGHGRSYKIANIIKAINNVKFKFESSTSTIKISCADNSDENKRYISHKVNLLKFLHKKLKLKINNVFFLDNSQIKSLPNNYIIYGAGNAGLQTKFILENFYNEKVIFFIDDNKKKIGTFLNKVKVISYNDLFSFFDGKITKKIIVAIPSLSQKKRIEIAKKLLPHCDEVKFLPEKREIFNNKIDPLDLRNVQFSDIFYSKKLNFRDNLNFFFKDKRVLVTGASGSIGSELCRQIINYKPKILIGIDKSEIGIYNLKLKLNKYINKKKVFFNLQDILDTERNKELIKKFKINIVIHAAANKHVNILEENVPEAVKNNVLGTISILNSLNANVKNLIFISTDKAVNPTSVLGITKRLSEIFILNHFHFTNLKFLKANIVRFGNVFASEGSVIHLFIKQILTNSLITITNKNVRRYFMSITDSCYLIINTLKLNIKNSVIVFKIDKDFKILNIIHKLATYLKINIKDLKIKEIGLQQGEKIKEEFSYSNEYSKTKFTNILKSKEDFVIDKNVILYNSNYLQNNYSNINKFKLKKILTFINSKIKN
jgi:FlaA1/EpsC-like NDP-sugar epimerase